MRICVSKAYGQTQVFENLALEISEGEIFCVLGESGGGKTTLLNILSGLTGYTGELQGVPDSVGYIFQEPRLLPNLTVEQNLRYVGGKDEEIEEILQKTELYGLRKKYPKQLSGGEKQRVNIARAFLVDAPLLLMDEPFSSLDTGLKIRLAKVFAELWEKKKPTTVFVTHDIEEACMLAHRVAVLKKGKIALDMQMPSGVLPREYGKQGEEKEKILGALLDKR